MKKYKRLFAFGCSFTNYYWPCWPEILAYELDIPCYNFGKKGAGNNFIFNRVMQIDALHNFTDEDLVIVSWTNVCREDRWVRGGWIVPGNIFTQREYDKNFVDRWVDPIGCAIRDFALIHSVKKFLENKKVDHYFFQMIDITKFTNQWDTKFILNHENKHVEKLVKTYGYIIQNILPSFFDVLWNNNIDVKFKKESNIIPEWNDGHPDPMEHLQYLEKVLNFEFSEKTKEKIASIQNMYEQIILNFKSHSDKKFIKNYADFFKLKEELTYQQFSIKENFDKSEYFNKFLFE